MFKVNQVKKEQICLFLRRSWVFSTETWVLFMVPWVIFSLRIFVLDFHKVLLMGSWVLIRSQIFSIGSQILGPNGVLDPGSSLQISESCPVDPLKVLVLHGVLGAGSFQSSRTKCSSMPRFRVWKLLFFFKKRTKIKSRTKSVSRLSC